ncbi:hypothetical protein [Parablautia muri]|uniref:hypothetical protein n=1 Tax=Parablautia muri TaxID=2320879 RepID=UPI001369E681|nr:hypothetical protein [Parablautia muri]
MNWMEKYTGNHLLFLYDFQIPFDDNMSEKGLRKAKNRIHNWAGKQNGKFMLWMNCYQEKPDNQ